MNRYISDLHFGCKNSFDKRTLEDDERIVKNWNSIVCNNDTTYILGDIGILGGNKTEYVCSMISRLKGNRVLIIGNHDRKELKDARIRQLFTEICDYKELSDNYKNENNETKNQKLVLSHYPIFSWNGCYKDTILLYGHTHANFDDKIYQDGLSLLRDKVRELNESEEVVKKFKKEPYAYNVGAMLKYIDYTPRTLEEILNNASFDKL